MAVVYHEDLAKGNENYNKYQAVNVIAQRARELNARGLPGGSVGVRQKLVIVATQELVDGTIKYEKGTAKAPAAGLMSMFEEPIESPDDDGWNEGIFEEDFIAQEDDPEEVEPEEGI